MAQVSSNTTVHDVVVIGSGAGGGTVTNVLANLGVSVLLIEAGPARSAGVPPVTKCSPSTSCLVLMRCIAAAARAGTRGWTW